MRDNGTTSIAEQTTFECRTRLGPSLDHITDCPPLGLDRPSNQSERQTNSSLWNDRAGDEKIRSQGHVLPVTTSLPSLVSAVIPSHSSHIDSAYLQNRSESAREGKTTKIHLSSSVHANPMTHLLSFPSPSSQTTLASHLVPKVRSRKPQRGKRSVRGRQSSPWPS